jgi:hypothetical protein
MSRCARPGAPRFHGMCMDHVEEAENEAVVWRGPGRTEGGARRGRPEGSGFAEESGRLGGWRDPVA